MRILVFGAAGQLGRQLCPRLSGEVVPLQRADVDLADVVRVREVIMASRPGLVVNCAAFNLVDRAEQDPGPAFTVNAWAVRAMAEACEKIQACLVHFSTDYVFGLDHSRRRPWRIDDPPGPINLYGLSKLTGEYLVRSICSRHLLIRTCGLYGPHGSGGKGKNFVDTMRTLARSGKPLRVVTDQRCTPSYAVDVAETSAALIRAGAAGLHHVTNTGECSWFDLACEILRLEGITAAIEPISSAAYGAPARRPAYSVLALDALQAVGVPTPRSWQEAVAAYLREV